MSTRSPILLRTRTCCPEEIGANQDLVVRALATLPVRMRAALVLRFFADLSEVDTAAALHCSVGTVKSQTSRGLARLRELLDNDQPQTLPANDGRG